MSDLSEQKTNKQKKTSAHHLPNTMMKKTRQKIRENRARTIINFKMNL